MPFRRSEATVKSPISDQESLKADLSLLQNINFILLIIILIATMHKKYLEKYLEI